GSDYEYERFQKSTKHTQNALLKLMHIMQWQLFSFSSLTRLFQLVALVTAVVSIVVYEANIATVFLILTYTSYVAEKLFVFGNNALRNYNRSFGDASDMTKKLLIQSEIADPKKPQKSDIHNGSLEFKNVTFTHDGNKDSIFKNLDLRIKPGEKIGLVGHSGSGKTTLTRLIMRFSDIDDGSITIDGQDIRNITQDDL